MKITVLCVGKLKERFWREACDEYLKRLGPYVHIGVREVADRDPAAFGGDDAARNREAEDLLKCLRPNDHVVLLAIEGKQRSSEDFSRLLDGYAMTSVDSIVFIIGSSTGVAPSVERRANETLSFGPITLPHNLARVVLLEQVYRAFRISRGEPYHK